MKFVIGVVVAASLVLAGSVMAFELSQETVILEKEDPSGSHGSAPNSGDGVSDGSGMDGGFGSSNKK